MPLRVHCPNGCLLKLPTGRAGQRVRCRECGDVIQLPSISSSEKRSGKPIPVHAKRVLSDVDHSSDLEAIEVKAKTQDVETGVVNTSSVELEKENSDADIHQSKRLDDTDATPMDNSNVENEFDGKGTDDWFDNESTNAAEDFQAVESAAQAGQSFEPASYIERGKNSGSARKSGSHIDLASLSDSNSDINFDFSQLTEDRHIEGSDVPIVIGAGDRITIHDDRTLLVKFFAFCLALLGLVMALPAAWHWWHLSGEFLVQPLPRWVFLLLFVGGLHVVYAFFLFQVVDWSALWSVAIVMVVLTAVYGFVAAGVWLDEGRGPIVRFLQVPNAFMRNATIWTLVMVCISGLSGYIFGREAIVWKQATG
jgi:hypothetical protein